MTRDEAYRELRSYRAEIARCESYNRHIRELRGRMYSLRVGGQNERVQGNGVSETVEKLIDEIDNYAERYAAVILGSEKKREDIERKLGRLAFPSAEVLRRKYIDAESYEKIAVEMSRRYKRCYSYENVRLLAFRAVGEYAKIE